MKKINCPKCGKELINLLSPNDPESEFWCDDCNTDIIMVEEDDKPVDWEGMIPKERK